MQNDILVSVIFSTELLSENIKYNKNEILGVKWYDMNEIINGTMDSELRDAKLIKAPIINLTSGKISPIDIINEF